MELLLRRRQLGNCKKKGTDRTGIRVEAFIVQVCGVLVVVIRTNRNMVVRMFQHQQMPRFQHH